MSAAEWRQVNDVRAQLRLAQRLWMCPLCYIRSINGTAWRQQQCSDCLGRPIPMRLTPRRMRLIACGLCRFLGDELTGAPAHRALEVAERFADGEVAVRELDEAHRQATAPAARAATLRDAWQAVTTTLEEVLARLTAVHEARLTGDLHAELTQVLVTSEAQCGHLGRGAVKAARKHLESRIRQHFAELQARAVAAEGRALTEVMRDVLGDPFDRVRIHPCWLEAEEGRVLQVAGSIYEEGRFEEMPVLADALQDAGCTDERLLEHCLEDRHYRGCWLLDAILEWE